MYALMRIPQMANSIRYEPHEVESRSVACFNRLVCPWIDRLVHAQRPNKDVMSCNPLRLGMTSQVIEPVTEADEGVEAIELARGGGGGLHQHPSRKVT